MTRTETLKSEVSSLKSRKLQPSHVRLHTSDFTRQGFVLLLALAIQAPARAQAPADGWSQFRGNARLTGIATSAPPAAPALRWSYEAGEAIDSSPAIADGSVYVGTSNGDLVAIDLASGKPRWKYATGSQIGATLEPQSSPLHWLSAAADLGDKSAILSCPARARPAPTTALALRVCSRSSRSLIEERHDVPIKPGAGDTSHIAAR